MERIPYLTKNWYEVAAIKAFTDRIYDIINIIRNGNRKEAIAVYNDPEGLPMPEDLKVCWGDKCIPLLSTFDEINFEKTYILEKNQMLKKLDGVNNEQ